jgi:hypothetical protein
MRKLLLTLLVILLIPVLSYGGLYINGVEQGGGINKEEAQDIMGDMFSGNTETRCTVTYQDGDGTIDVVVDDLDTTLTEEEVEDYVGGMLGGTETLISVTYQDDAGDIDFVIDSDLHKYSWSNVVDSDITDTLTCSTCTGNAATVTTNANLTGDVTSTGNATDITESVLENGGTDEISVEGLSGLLADDQHVLDAEVQAISINNVSEDTTPELGGELGCGAHSIGFTQQTATGDGTTTIDWKLGNKFKFTWGAQGETFTFTEPSNPCNLMLLMIQDGTGGRDATWPGTVKWFGTEPTWTDGGAGKGIGVAFYYDGTNYWGTATPWEL